MNKVRCSWVGKDPLYIQYHDKEWGVALYEDQQLFEFLILETFQAGLSWITVLRKRENFRKAFDNFDYVKISNYGQQKFDELLSNAGIIRNRLKIKATFANAISFMEVQKEFGSFSKYIWSFVNGKPLRNKWKLNNDVPANTELSDVISKDLKKRGFKFVGTTVIYAYMQATGMINDHTTNCFRYNDV
jgi:DNA-3-methyladenine glycosylase I|tara:strand:+ start:239 stop:802 length:564 start_codon:yes stop_codon:yes gene_type:complete